MYKVTKTRIVKRRARERERETRQTRKIKMKKSLHKRFSAFFFAPCRKFCHKIQVDEQKGWSLSRVQYCASCHCFSTGDRVSVPDSIKITSLDIVTHTLFLELTLSLKTLDSGDIYTYKPSRDARKTYCYDNVTLCKQQQLAHNFGEMKEKGFLRCCCFYFLEKTKFCSMLLCLRCLLNFFVCFCRLSLLSLSVNLVVSCFFVFFSLSPSPPHPLSFLFFPLSSAAAAAAAAGSLFFLSVIIITSPIFLSSLL